MVMWKTKSCPRCGGDTFIDNDMDGWYEQCLQCGYRSELEGMAARYPNFHYLPIIDETDRDPGWQGRVGFVNSLVEDGTIAGHLGQDLDPANTSVFLCGNPLMVESMMALLSDLGFTKHTRQQPGNLLVEEYWK